MRIISFIAVTFLFTLSTYGKAEIITRSFDGNNVVFMNGAIEKGDMQRLVSLPIDWKRTIVLLNSDGGSTGDAIVISAFLVTNNVVTVVLPDHRCMSECALIWLSGFRKMLANSSIVGFGDSAYELNDEEKQLIGPMFLGEQFDPNISGLGFIAVGILLQKGLGIDFGFVSEFLAENVQSPKYLDKGDFDKYGIAVVFENDDNGELRDALRASGILSD